MNKIIRIWNQNRRKIIIIALVIVFFFILLQVLNQMAKSNIEKNNAKQENKEKENLPTKSIITGEVVKEETTKTNVEVINTFADNCNNKDIDSAYSLLTEECKEILFPTKDSFINNYYNVIFSENRTIKIENYKNSSKNNTYKVTFYGDALSTGNISGTDKYQDYITIDKETKKLNINSLITSNEMNSEKEVNGIKIQVLRQDIYIDYEKYEIKVENNTDKTVMIDTLTSSKKIYVVDNDNIKYTAFTSEIANNLLELPKYVTKTYSIKFNKKYNPSSKIKKVVFSDIVEDYEKYKQEKTEDRLKIEVDL